MTRTRSTAEVLSEAGLLPKGNGLHGAKTKADKQYGDSLCTGIVRQVELSFVNQGVPLVGFTNYQFDQPATERELDVAFPAVKVCLELQGYAYHKHRGKMNDDYMKLAKATLLGWRVFFCTAAQAKAHGALWLIHAIEQELGNQ